MSNSVDSPIALDASPPLAGIPILTWPSAERPRERLRNAGPASLSDAELLSLTLRTGLRGRTAVDIARMLLTQCGSLRGVLQASDTTLASIPGVGPAKIAQIRAMQETVQRALREQLQQCDVTLDNGEAVADYLRLLIGHRQREIFVVLFLDARSRLLAGEELAIGTIDRATVYPREIVTRALVWHATSVIVAHNHPSGFLRASAADITLTKRLQQALGLLEIPLLDHIIVSASGYFSFSDRGLLSIS